MTNVRGAPALSRRMIVTDDFVYVHMPKTGGTFVEAAVARLYARRRGLYIDTTRKRDRRRIGGADQHQTVRDIPAAYRDRPIAFTVRNPFDHWVSFYEFGWWRTHPGDTFDEGAILARYPHYPEISFAEYLYANYELDLLDRGSMPPALARRLEAAGVGPLTYEYVRFLSLQPKRVLDDPRAFFLGPHRVHTPLDVRFLHQEALNAELYDFLRSVGQDAASVRFVLEMGRVFPHGGPRRRSPTWEDRYTPELRGLVREREALLFGLLPDYG